MEIIFAKSKWEVWEEDTENFLKRVKEDGYDATEFYFNEASESPEELSELHEKYNLKIIAQFLTEGTTFEEHLESINYLSEKALRCNPLLINCHPGKDFFTPEENKKILSRLCAIQEEYGILVTAETHRGRATYSLIETVKFLERIPELSLAADFSHWMVVHESNLLDQEENLNLAIARSRHIHARVGYEEGPQVPDPRAPEWNTHLDNHMAIWKKIIKQNENDNREFLTITPEFGPPNYMHTLPFSKNVVADAWEINLFMKDLIKSRIRDGLSTISQN